jgi:serine/threonine protein kinase
MAEFQLSRGTADSTRDSAPKASTCDTSTLVSSMVFGDEQIDLSDVVKIGKAEQWLLDEKDIKFAGACTLGIGASASVQRACYHSASVAVKHCKPTVNTQKNMLLLCNELRILRRMRHPNIISFYGAIVDFESFTMSLVIELALGPSLQTLIDGGNKAEFIPTMKERIVILSAICGVLSYLHTRSPVVVHGDLSPLNVHVERVMEKMRGWICKTKLLDFGLSRIITKRARPLGGTLQWVAPEVFGQNNVLTALPQASDIYSFGRIAHAFFTGARDARSEGAIMRALRRGDVTPLIWPIDALRNRFTSKCVPILDRCCLADASARPDIAEVHQVFMTLIDEGIEELATDGVDTNNVSL